MDSSFCDPDGVLGPVWQSMALHPKYLEAFKTAHNFLMNGDGPLQHSDRHYIAIMASSRHSCSELISQEVDDFKGYLPASVGPDVQSWLDSGLSVEKAPAKLKQLQTLNKMLAHRPWMVNKNHIKELTQNENGSKWSLSELVHAIVLMCHFHAFSAFILGCGNMDNGSVKEEPAEDDLDSISMNAEEVLKNADETGDPDHVPLIVKKMETLSAKKEELELEEVERRFAKINVHDQEISGLEFAPRSRSRTLTPLSSDDDGNAETKIAKRVLDPANFSEDLCFQYIDFVKRENHDSYPTFRSQEFSWEDHGFTTVNRFFSDDMGQLLDDKFNMITNLTYMTIGNYQSVDTRLFRRAVQCYIQCLYGIRHDDYDYGDINELLPRTLKKYIKTVSCYPELCTRDEYEAIMSDFKTSEKVHVCILVCEAKFQSELIYALKAVADYYA